MVDVTEDNFSQLLPQILEDIKRAAFISMDTEFTGLLADAAFKGSLFDDGLQRYQKLSCNIRKFMICQMGLAVFKGIPHTNGYTVTSYNFYLRPHSCTSFDPTFMCQTSSLEFLQRFKFDFNKWLYGGITSMNTDEENELCKSLTSIFEGQKIVELPYTVRDQLSDLGVWAASAKEGDIITVTQILEATFQFMLVVSIRHRFPDLWASVENGEVVIQKVTGDNRQKLELQDVDGQKLVECFVDRMLGFTKIFRYLVDTQKPVVLHNCLLDLMLIYKQFHKHLPRSYSTFKSDLHQLFPTIYDTKLLAAEIKNSLRQTDDKVGNVLGNTSLSNLATSLKKDHTALYKPSVRHVPETNKYNGEEMMLHEAGYDAYLTGSSFLNLAHLYAMLQLPSKAQHRPMSPREHVHALKNFANRVQMQRASIPYMELSGRDPKSKRPPWLVVERHPKTRGFSPSYVSSILAQYGYVDVVPRDNKSVLVAAASWDSTREILKTFREGGSLKASRYSKLKHSSFIRSLAWSGALVSAGLSSWLIYSTFKKASS
ncbi:pre-piRNA 3'-exonuclease trimmer-like [Penaeus japonicus]|uniref:pre-piRNA 3'-exonuclease trimmer-like n=1 Tax=Penaeus japonicus TaxID=27405 RepID=UPI001C70EA07|nr:pre-piRNA 3'-exonuclease trimmer-like [Penaeus japonicus]